MKIIINTGVLLSDNQENYRSFLNEVLKIIINQYQQHEFIILTDDFNSQKILPRKNVKEVIIHYPVRHPLFWKLWHDVKLPAIVKKYNADIFVSCDGFCSLTTRIPQCLLLYDLSFLYNSTVIGRSHLFFYKRYMNKFLQKATVLVCWSDFEKKDLMLRYKINESKLKVVYPAVKSIYQPLNEFEKEEIKRKQCDEKNYFIYTGAIHYSLNLLSLLKAFSVFKKRQKSNWKLLLTGSMNRKNKNFIEDLRTYKYRDDVVLAGNTNEDDKIKLIASAYAVICTTHSIGSVFSILQAMNCHVPVIAAGHPVIKEIAGDTALYTDPSDHENIANQMMILYKDESLRTNLIEKGKTLSARYSLDKAAELLWQCIHKAEPALQVSKS